MSTSQKIILVIICFIFAVIGFLIKIPVPLRGHDKFWHTSFYFIAAAFLHYLFRKRIFFIVIALTLFGVLIEYLQQLANKLTRSHIHGRFDIEDVYANCKGLLLYSLLVLTFFIGNTIYKNFRSQ